LVSGGKLQFLSDFFQKLFGRYLGLGNENGLDALVQSVKDVMKNRRLPGSRLPGNGDKTLPFADPIQNGFQRVLVGLGEKEKFGIRGYLKRLLGKPIKMGVHSLPFTSGKNLFREN
jgi:hypothetical protein